MGEDYFSHILRMILASAICTAMIGFGFSSRRKDNSRRWVFVIGGVVGSALTILTIIASQERRNLSDSFVVEFIAGVGLLLLALALIVVGKRGRRIGDHPMCRACGFDLFGKPPESTCCSECGVELGSPKSIVIGVRQSFRGVILAGVFFLCLGLMLSGQPAYQFANEYDWNRLKPTSWLVTDLKSRDPRKVRAAYESLATRIQDSGTSSSQVQTLAELALKDAEAGRPSPLLYLVQSVIDHHDVLDERTTRRLMRQIANQTTFGVPRQLLQGRPILFGSWFMPLAAGESHLVRQYHGWSNLDATVRAETFRINGNALPADAIKLVPNPYSSVYSIDQPVIDPGAEWSKIPLGPINISRDMTLRVTLNYRGGQLEEIVPVTERCASNVIPRGQGQPQLRTPTQDELNEVWSAEIADGQSTILIITRQHDGGRVCAKVVVIDADGRHELGVIDMLSQLNSVMIPWTLPLPDKASRLELVPDPIDAAGGWDFSPILNQTIRIPSIARTGSN